MDLTKKSNRHTLSQKAYEYIKRCIVLGKIKGGEVITEKSIGDILNMSRTPVKKALTQLEVENFVKCIDGVGTIVVGLSIRDLSEVYEVRTAMEVMALRTAISRIDKNELFMTKQKVENVLENYNVGNSITVDYISSIDAEVHSLIMKNSTNNYIKSLMNTIESRIDRYRYEAYNLTDTGEESARQHLKLLNFIEAGDYENAKEFLKEHIHWSFTVLSKALTNLQC